MFSVRGAVSTAAVNAVPAVWALAVTAALRPGLEKNVITHAKICSVSAASGAGALPCAGLGVLAALRLAAAASLSAARKLHLCVACMAR